MIDQAGIVEHVSWAESVAVASFRTTTLVDRDDLRGYAAEAVVALAGSYDNSRGTFHTYLRSCLRYTIIDLLRRDFGRSVANGGIRRSVMAVRSIEEDRHRTNSDGRGTDQEPDYLGYDPHVDDETVDRVYAEQVASMLDESVPGDYVLAETARGRSLSDVGRELGVTESRACQLRTKTRKRLLAELAH